MITDYGEAFEAVRAGYTGKLYAEIASRTFTVVVRAGMTYKNQLVLFVASRNHQIGRRVRLKEPFGKMMRAGLSMMTEELPVER